MAGIWTICINYLFLKLKKFFPLSGEIKVDSLNFHNKIKALIKYEIPRLLLKIHKLTSKSLLKTKQNLCWRIF